MLFLVSLVVSETREWDLRSTNLGRVSADAAIELEAGAPSLFFLLFCADLALACSIFLAIIVLGTNNFAKSCGYLNNSR